MRGWEVYDDTYSDDDAYQRWFAEVEEPAHRQAIESTCTPARAIEEEKKVALNIKDSGGADFKKLPPGAHFAICNMIIDCGMQPGYQGKAQHKLYIRWEVPDERVEYTKDGVAVEGPMTIGRFYTASLSEKAQLRTDLENWRGQAFTESELKGFDVFKVAGKACQIQVVHSDPVNGKVYANINGIMGLSKDQRPRAKDVRAENRVLTYSLDAPDPEMFDALPNWLKEKIQKRLDEGAGQHVPAAAPADFNDDIPF